MATKLGSVIDDIVTSAHVEMTKTANDNLSSSGKTPTISTEIGQALMKTAALLKEATSEISYEDLRNFMEHIRNA